MRKKKFAATAVALALAAVTAFSVGNTPSVKAADVTSKTPIDLEINGSYEEKQISKADAKVINETLGYDLAVNNIIVCGDNATGYIDYEKSSVPCMTFQSFYQEYLENQSADLRASTLATKEHIVALHIMPYFKDRELASITAEDIIKWQNKIKKKSCS